MLCNHSISPVWGGAAGDTHLHVCCIAPAPLPHHQKSLSLSSLPSHRSRDSNKAPPLHRVASFPGGSGGEEGSFFQSEIVMREAEQNMIEYQRYSDMLPKYADFDVAGKKLFLDQMEGVLERARIFYARLTLSDDPLVKENLNNLSKQFLFLSTNIKSVHDGMEEQLKSLRGLLVEEEKIVDFQELAAFRQKLRAILPDERLSAVQKNLSMENIMKDPSIMTVLSSNPRALLAIQEMMEKGPSAVEKYRDDAALYSVLQKIFNL